jgi:hypothetical protein
LSALVLDKRKRPVMPCREKRARQLLERDQAVIHRRYRFTIRLKDRVGGDVEPDRGKLDPGSRTRIAVVAGEDGNKPVKVLCLFELAHQGRQISEARVGWQQATLAIKASARADDGRTKLTFPPDYCMRTKSVPGFQTGDMARAEVPTGNQAGTHVGRVAVGGCSPLRVGNADQRHVLQTSPSRGRPLLRPATRAPSPS